MSPTILQYRAYRFFFFSNEGSPLEPIHIHIRKGGALAKFWIEPNIFLAENYGFNSKELKEIEQKVREHEQKIRARWEKFFAE